MSDKIQEYRGKAIAVRFDGRKCIHSRNCVLGEPGVFEANAPGPWIHPDLAPVEAIVRVAHNCPSGAITYLRTDGGAHESAPAVNAAQVRENGPLALRADLRIDGEAVGFRATLCRCGASNNKPYCDASHVTIAFTATGEPATTPSEPLAQRGGELRITATKNGPLEVIGGLEICSGTGRTVNRTQKTWLCRCGGSANKPYCDGSHKRTGFTA